MDFRVPQETYLAAGEIWVRLRELEAKAVGSNVRHPARNEDGSLNEDRINNSFVRDLSWMIHNKFQPLVDALAGPPSDNGKLKRVKADLQAIIDGID